jgi:uncharacterized protein YjbI with pentapeptide repeats
MAQDVMRGKSAIAYPFPMLLCYAWIKIGSKLPSLVMPQNFSGKNLQGRSFKGQDLAGANFSNSDIRGADFTNAKLIGANFSHTKAGLQRGWAIVLVIISLLLSALSGFASAYAGAATAIMFGTKDPWNVSGQVLRITLLVFFILTIRQGLVVALGALSAAAIGAAAVAAFLAWVQAVTVSKAAILGVIWIMAEAVAKAIAAAGAVVVTGAVIMAVAVAGAGTGGVAMAVAGTVVGAVAGAWVVAVAEAGIWAVKWAVAMAVAVVGLCAYVAWRTLAGDEKHTFLRAIAIAFAATGGTSFRKADLTDANFTSAMLKSTDFRGAILTRTRWYQAKKLDRARVDHSLLTKASVRDLLVSGNGYKKSYEGESLRGANLAGANLNEANLQEADLNEATLQGANLEGANLTQIQAIATDFTGAYLTGACLEAWNIDSTTKLEQIDCRYVYLLQGQQERRPSSGEFQAGEFTKLFQEVLNTVDLIFRNGVDWKAFAAAFNKIQVENEGTELAIRSIENKGDGVVVVKVSLPPDANKEKIDSNFTQNYELILNAIEEKYQAKLDAKNEVIESYRQQLDDYRQRERQQNAEMKEIISMLASRPVNVPVNLPEIKAIAERQLRSDKLVILTLGNGDFERGFPSVTAQIWTEGDRLPTQCLGELLPAPEIPELYSRWQSLYNGLELYSRLESRANQVSNFSKKDIYSLAEELEDRLNQWLNSETFRPIDKSLREKFIRSDELQVIIQSENLDVRRLPWHLWDFFKSYRKAEMALSAPFYDRVAKSASPRAQRRILSILGDSTGINVEKDRNILENLHQAETTFLVEPTRKELDKQLWDEQGWDILCFSGHSSSQWDGKNGWIYINKTDKLTIEQLENALLAAIERGLQLAIFNSCDGLGLAKHLACLHIPQIIVMREPVPDLVAQEFLKNFLRGSANGKSFYLSVRQAREMLQGLEDEFPCATWLPVICHNPAEVPLTW